MPIFLPCLNHAFNPFVTFVQLATLLTIPLLEPSLSFMPRSTTATLSFSIFFAVNLIAFNLYWTVQLGLFKKNPRFSHISPILKSLHWLKIDQCIQYKVLSHTYKTLQSQNLLISAAFSTCKLTPLVVHLLLFLFSDPQSTIVSK